MPGVDPQKAEMLTRLLGSPLLLAREYIKPVMAMLVQSEPQAALPQPAGAERPYPVVDGLALINVSGVLVFRPSVWFRGYYTQYYQDIGDAFEQAMQDPEVEAVFMNYDSPGGMIHGCFDTADRIYAARGRKPIIAMVNEIAYSAAYALASAADEIVIAQTGGAGSIGVIQEHVDQSGLDEMFGLKYTTIAVPEHKDDGNPHRPLDDKAAKAIRSRVVQLYEMFVALVARNRNLDAEAVRGTQGETLIGIRAVEAGLVDRVGEVNALVAELVGGRGGDRSSISSLAKGEQTMTVPKEQQPTAQGGQPPQPQAPTGASPPQAPASTGQQPPPEPSPAPQTPPQGGQPSQPQVPPEGAPPPQYSRETQIAALLTAAGMPDRIAGYLIAGTSLEQVQRDITAARANGQVQTEIQNQVDPTQAPQMHQRPDEHPLVKAAQEHNREYRGRVWGGA